MKASSTLFALIRIVLLVLLPVAVEAQVTAIKAGKLVDPETGRTSVNQVVLVEDGKTKRSGRACKCQPGRA